MGKEGDRDAAIVWITRISGLFVVHRRIDYLEELAEEIFLGMRARCVYHNSVQVVELCVAETCFRQGRVGLECLSRAL